MALGKLSFLLIILLFSVNLQKGIPNDRVMKKVLVLHSYNQGLQWTDHQNASLRKVLLNAPNFKIDIRTEYLDVKHYQDTASLTLFNFYIQEKYRNDTFDLIIATDNAAYDFLKEHTQFTKNTPVVFSGLNYVEDIPENFTGLIEDIDIYSNLNLIRELHPKETKINVIIDHSITGEKIFEQTQKVIATDFPKLSYEYLRDYSYVELKNKLQSLADNEVIFLIIFNIDKNELSIPYDEILTDLQPFTEGKAIYGPWDFYLNKGIIGGKITSARYHGAAAGNIALEILNGKEVSEIPIVKGPTKYIFDYKELNKFHIDMSKLPKESILINERQSLVSENKGLFVIFGVVLIGLVFVIIFLTKVVTRVRKILNKEREYIQQIKSQRQELREALQAAQKANALQKAFLANISHETRTPMNSILGFAEIILEEFADNDHKKQYLKHIITNGNHLIGIIDNLLVLSRIDTDQLNVHKEKIYIRSLIEDVYTGYKLRLGSKDHVEFHLAKLINSDTEGVLYTDKILLRQVLINLIDNAFKFTKEGFIELGYEQTENEIKFYVRDTGIGIRPVDYEIIFDRFGQVEKGHSKYYYGTGLGLSISKAYVEELGGNIWLESEVGKGSVFYFSIPSVQ